jgi:hypothetical protein
MKLFQSRTVQARRRSEALTVDALPVRSRGQLGMVRGGPVVVRGA